MFDVLLKGRKADYPGLPYNPPAMFTLNEWVEVASLLAARGDDGADVKVFEYRAPAPFFRICVYRSRDYRGFPLPGVVLTTGSGQGDLALRMAVAFSEGMLGVAEVLEVSK